METLSKRGRGAVVVSDTMKMLLRVRVVQEPR